MHFVFAGSSFIKAGMHHGIKQQKLALFHML